MVNHSICNVLVESQKTRKNKQKYNTGKTTRGLPV